MQWAEGQIGSRMNGKERGRVEEHERQEGGAKQEAVDLRNAAKIGSDGPIESAFSSGCEGHCCNRTPLLTQRV